MSAAGGRGWWVVDGYGDDAVIERMLSFWLPLRDVSNAQTMQQFIDRYITFNEVNAEQKRQKHGDKRIFGQDGAAGRGL